METTKQSKLGKRIGLFVLFAFLYVFMLPLVDVVLCGDAPGSPKNGLIHQILEKE